MALFEGKSTTERNKIIAAGVLGVVALVALYLAFFSRTSTTATTTKSTPTPTPTISTSTNNSKFRLPTAEEQALDIITPVVYRQGGGGPDAGRNIFAFYEPAPPCPECPKPIPTPTPVKPPTPAPTPPMLIAYANPQNVYAGWRGFRLEVNGERFVPESRIYFNQTELPTTFSSATKLVTDIPANLIAEEGPRQVIVQTPDGKLYSNQFILTVQAPPKPGFQYIGMIGRKRYNNDTAYFLDTGKPAPFGARLNDIVGGRFRLVDISPVEVVFEDVNLGFKHRLELTKTAAAGTGGATGAPTRPMDRGITPFDPATMPNPAGIPANIQRYVPPQNLQPAPTDRKPTDNKKEDVDDDGDGD